MPGRASGVCLAALWNRMLNETKKIGHERLFLTIAHDLLYIPDYLCVVARQSNFFDKL